MGRGREIYREEGRERKGDGREEERDVKTELLVRALL